MGNRHCVKCGVPLDYYKNHKSVGNSCRVHNWVSSTKANKELDEKTAIYFPCSRCLMDEKNIEGNCYHDFQWNLF